MAFPLPPPRAQSPSSPGIPAEVFTELRDLSREVVVLGTELRTRLAALEHAQSIGTAASKTETLKILAGAVTSVVLAVVGSRVVAPKPEPTTTVIQRSAYDRAIEACQKIETDADRAACIVKVSADAVGPSPR